MIYCQTTPLLKTLGQFENSVFVIMSTRENIRLIARSSFLLHEMKEKNIIIYNFFALNDVIHVGALRHINDEVA